MNSIKPKEPLLTILLNAMWPGFGQIYTKRITKGLALSLVAFAVVIATIIYCLKPDTIFDIFQPLICALIALVYQLYAYIDGYRSALSYNKSNKILYKTSVRKKIIYISLIIFTIFIFNPIGYSMIHFTKSNIAESYKITSKAMYPTLHPGDKLFADKMIYKRAKPERGDLVVFAKPGTSKNIEYVKRIVGLPGDSIEIKDTNIYLDGKKVVSPDAIQNIAYYNNVKGPYGRFGQIINVPNNYYFVLGDNSAASLDSRYFGFVPTENIRGKIYKRWWPFDRQDIIE